MFIENFWYMAGWPEEVAAVPIRRIIMNQPIVMFRCSDGVVAALEDRCSHRNFPISKGDRRGDALQCGYHGLTFDRKGICIYAPGQDRPPPRADIRAYPLEERYGVAWIWMGDVAKADPSLIPDLSWMQRSGWTHHTGGYIHLKAPEHLLTENLLDISHLAYVHKSSMGSDPDIIAGCKIKVVSEQFGVRRITSFEDMPTPPIYTRSSLMGDRADQRTESVMVPGLYHNHTVLKNTGQSGWWGEGVEGNYPIRARSFHAVVPESDDSTHYFFGNTSMDIDIPVLNGAQAKKIFEEDVSVLESVYQNEKLVGNRPNINLRNDLAVMRWREFRERILNAPAVRIAN